MAGNTWGERFTVTTFGESHGPAIGCIVDGCPPGIEISEEALQADLDRRKPGTSRYVTQRREDDRCEERVGGAPAVRLDAHEQRRHDQDPQLAKQPQHRRRAAAPPPPPAVEQLVEGDDHPPRP